MKKLLLLWLCATAFAAQASDSTIRYSNYIYEGDIRSVQLTNAESGFNFPLIQVGEISKLMLNFDQLNPERDYYQFTLIHCDANWNPSNLQKSQYLYGTGFDNIDNATFSTGTLTQFTHYSITFPTENTKPRVAGNFLLLVYRNFDEKDIILSRRILVLDNKGALAMNVHSSSQVENRITHQEVDFTFNVTANNYFMPRPTEDLKVVMLQNGDWNSAITGLKPQFINGKNFNFDLQTGNQFFAGNEYRFFDVRTFQVTAAGVMRKFNIANQKHIILQNAISRQYDRYFNYSDYNGRFLISNKDLPATAGGMQTESDYCFVHFSLSSNEELKDKEVYVYGELSDWRIQESFKCYYNADNKRYELVTPLKQAYYNYIFVVKDKVTGELDKKYFENSFMETENNYIVLIYHKNQTLGYDELIGYGLKGSRDKD